MCGLVAVLEHDCDLKPGLDALESRGPDGRGTYAVPPIQLGQVRLATVDPGSGATLVSSEDGRTVAAVNGEIYDADDHLRTWLQARGHRLRTDRDSELLVHLFEEFGTDVFARLDAEFACAVWDGRRLVVARDRFGVKPLVYARLGEGWAIASEAKALFSLGVPRAWNFRALGHVLQFQYLLWDETLFSGVHVLPPGHYAVFTPGSAPTIHRYWSYAPEPAGPVRPELLADALRGAVRSRLRGDREVAVQLSGGLDSSSVAAFAGRRAFTVGFENPAYDESAAARAVAGHLEVPLEVVAVAEGDLEAAIVAGEGIAINGHIAAKYALARAIRAAGCAVVLTGDGADELFGGYAHFRRDVGAIEPVDPTVQGIHVPSDPTMSDLPTFLRAKRALCERLRGLLREDPTLGDPWADLAEHLPQTADPLTRAQIAWVRTGFHSAILRTLGDGMEGAWGLQGRVPFLANEVVRHATRLDRESLCGEREKALLSKAVSRFLPPIALRRKHPFMAPPIPRSVLAGRDLLFFDPDRVAALGEGVVEDALRMMVLSISILGEAYRL